MIEPLARLFCLYHIGEMITAEILWIDDDLGFAPQRPVQSVTHQRVQVSIVLLTASRFGLLKQGLLHIEARNTAPFPFLVVA